MHSMGMAFVMTIGMLLASLLDTYSQTIAPQTPTESKVDPKSSTELSISNLPLTIPQIRSNLPPTPADRFEFLRRQRKITLDAINDTTLRLKTFSTQIDIAQARKRELETIPAFQTDNSQEKDILNNKHIRLSKDMERLQVSLKNCEENTETHILKHCIDVFQNEINKLQEEVSNVQVQMKGFDKSKLENENKYKEREALAKSAATEVVNLEGQRDKSLQEQSYYQRLLNEIDDIVNQLFIANDANNSFRLRMSIAFSILVGVVIIGFFTIAFFNRNIVASIFSSDSGIQFITLFSLVIAIILFGIINILESRELSALLGGLSGYILGRGTNKNENINTSDTKSEIGQH